jgi:hypothetical protein
MKNARSAYIVLLTVMFIVTGNLAAHAQSAQQTGDQTKTGSSTTKQAGKKSADGTASPKKNSSKNSATSTVTTSPAAAPVAGDAASAPGPKTTPPKKTSSAKNVGMVWVNAQSGVYYKLGTRWYGKTKRGKYMTEAEAIKAGYHLAKKE